MKDLILIGAGGHGKDVCDAALLEGRYVAGFVDEDPSLWGRRVLGRPVLGGLELLSTANDADVVIAVSSPPAKKKIDRWIRRHGSRIVRSIVHPRAHLSPFATLEEGVVILAGALVQADAHLGRHAYVHTASSVSHDARIDDFVSIHPGAQIGGGARVGEGCFVGMGASILPRVRVGAWCTVGAGAVVLTDLPPEVTAVGVPARILAKNRPSLES